MARPNIIIVGGNPAARSVPPSCAEIIGKSVNDKIIDALNKLCEMNNVAVIRCCTERGIVDVDIDPFVKNRNGGNPNRAIFRHYVLSLQLLTVTFICNAKLYLITSQISGQF